MEAAEQIIQTQFTAIDWVIVGLYLSGSVAIGFLVRRFIADMSHYVVAGRAVKSYLGIATMIGTEMGLVTIMYMSEMGYRTGFSSFSIALIGLVVTLAVGLSGFIVVPLRRMGVMTIPEYYERRFSRGVRVFGGLLLALAGILNMGLFLKAGALFVGGITGLVTDWQINIIMTVLLILVLFYTILGGMVSVVLTDYVQFVVLSAGLIAVCFIAVGNLGWGNIVDTVAEQRGEAGMNPFHPEGLGAGYLFWMVVVALNSCAVWQTAVMRACAAESTDVVKKLYVWSSVGFLIRFLIPQFLGICAFVWLFNHGQIGNVSSLEAMPAFLGSILPPVVIGIFTAGMLAAFMSTHDSYLLCWSSVITQDVVAPLAKNELSTRARLVLTRVVIFVIGVFLLVWGLWYPLDQALWNYLAVTGAVYFCGAMPLLIFGIYWRGASTAGAYTALACGLLALLGLKPFKELVGLGGQDWMNDWSVGLMAVGAAFVLMIAVSLVFPDRGKEGSGA